MELVIVLPKKSTDTTVAWLHPMLSEEKILHYRYAGAYPNLRTVGEDIITCDRLVVPKEPVVPHAIVDVEDLPFGLNENRVKISGTKAMQFHYKDWCASVDAMLMAPGLVAWKATELDLLSRMCSALGGILHHRPDLIEHPAMIVPYISADPKRKGYAFGTMNTSNGWRVRCYGSIMVDGVIHDCDAFLARVDKAFLQRYGDSKNQPRSIQIMLDLMRHIFAVKTLSPDDVSEWRRIMDGLMEFYAIILQENVRSLAPHLWSQDNEVGTCSALARIRSLFCILDLCADHHMIQARQTGIHRGDLGWTPKHDIHRAVPSDRTWVYYLTSQLT